MTRPGYEVVSGPGPKQGKVECKSLTSIHRSD